MIKLFLSAVREARRQAAIAYINKSNDKLQILIYDPDGKSLNYALVNLAEAGAGIKFHLWAEFERIIERYID